MTRKEKQWWYGCTDSQPRVCQNTCAQARILYDRVLKTNIYFEFTTFLNYERGISRAGNSKSNNEKKFHV